MAKKILNFLVLGIVLSVFVGHLARAQSDTMPPTIPTGISAYVTQSNQVYVSWNGSTDNVGVVGYYLYRNGGFIANTPGLTYYLDTPTAGIYTYTVSAYDAAGNVSQQSSASSPLTVLADTTPPTTPTDFTAVSSSSSVALSWNASTDNFGVVGYYIYRNNVRLITSSVVAGTSYTDSGLTPGVTYRYSIVAYDAAGNLSGQATANATTIYDITPPSVPTGLSAIAVSDNQINLTWQSSTDNVAVAGYNVYQDGSVITQTAAPSYEAAGLSPATEYSFSVSAYDTVGNVSNQSINIDATTLAQDLIPPTAPASLSATPVSASEIDLSWPASHDNVGVAGYNVYQDGSQITTVTSTFYADTGLTTSTSYDYAVSAYDAAGNVSPDATTFAVTLATNPASAPTSTASIILPMIPAPTSSIIPTSVITPSVPSSVTSPPPIIAAGFTTSLYFGMRNGNVTTLQLILIQQGDLGASYSTGYFGLLTQKAVQDFQCNENIICSGSPFTTGWGMVGPRTRKVLNTL